MKNCSILLSMPTGNGAYIAHHLLDTQIQVYRAVVFNPLWTFIPLMLPMITSLRDADLIHTIQRKCWGAKIVGATYRKKPQEIAELIDRALKNQITGYVREGLRLAGSPSSFRNPLERHRIA